MKIGIRKPSLKKSIKARTTGKIKRKLKKAVIPGYGKKGVGWIKDPKKALYNKIYNKTSVSIVPPIASALDPEKKKIVNREANTMKKKHTLLWILGWLIIFPVPLTILLSRSQKMNKGLKIAGIAAAWLVYLLIAIIGATPSSKSNESETPTVITTEASTEAITEAVTEAQTEAVTEAQTEAVTEAQTEAATEAQTEAATEAQTEAVTEAQTEAPKENIAAAPVRSTNSPATAEDAEYIANKNSGVVHTNHCSSLPIEKNRVYFHSTDEARAAGYTNPCDKCRPW